MKSPVVAIQIIQKPGKGKGVDVVPCEHPAFNGREFTSVMEALQSLADYRETSGDKSAIEKVFFVQLYDF